MSGSGPVRRYYEGLAEELHAGPGWNWSREVTYPEHVAQRLRHWKPFGLEWEHARTLFLDRARQLGLQ